MIELSSVQGAIFDVDETLLDTGVISDPLHALHEQARLQAVHEAGARHDLPRLSAITLQENWDGFMNAPVHSLEGAVWNILFMAGIVTTRAMEPAHPLLREIVDRKDELYETLLRNEGKPVPGAVEFVGWLATQPFGDRLAIASTAIRRDINIFLEKFDLVRFFPVERIIAKDNVARVKPHPEAFDKAFLSLGLPESARGQVLAFEDNPRGVMSAKAAGLYTCCITTAYPKQDLLSLDVPPDLVADSFAEFRSLLQHPRQHLVR